MPRRDWTVRTALCAERLPMTHGGMRAGNETAIIIDLSYIVYINIGDKEVNNSPVPLRAPSIINKDGLTCGRQRHSSMNEGRQSSHYDIVKKRDGF